MAIEIKIKKKRVNGRAVRILTCRDIKSLHDYAKSHYLKAGWRVEEKPHLIGIFRKRYRMTLVEK